MEEKRLVFTAGVATIWWIGIGTDTDLIEWIRYQP